MESGFLCTELVCLEELEPDENPTVTSCFGSAYPCLHRPGLEQVTKQSNIFNLICLADMKVLVHLLVCCLVWFGLVWPGLAWFGLVWPGLAWFGLHSVGQGDGEREEGWRELNGL